MAASKFEKALKEITSTYGDKALVPASSVRPPARISTGLFGLDVMLGGGFPLGRVTELVGEPSGGKSSLVLSAVAQAQLTDRNTYRPLQRHEGSLVDPETGEVGVPMRAVWIDTEATFDHDWARRIGVDVEELYVAPAAYLEAAYDMVMALIRTGEVDVLVIDSIAAMAPATEMDASMEDQQMGVAARGNNKGLRKITAEFNRIVQTQQHAPAVIMINQMREKIGVIFGSPITSPGGRGQEFFASLRINVWAEALSKAIKDGDDIVGRTSSYKIEKNKVNGMYGQAQFSIYVRDFGPYRKGAIDDSYQILEAAGRFGVIEQNGAFYTMPDGTKMQGKAKALSYLWDRPEVFTQVRNEVLDRAGAVRRS